jgi:hypothetical protein
MPTVKLEVVFTTRLPSPATVRNVRTPVESWPVVRPLVFGPTVTGPVTVRVFPAPIVMVFSEVAFTRTLRLAAVRLAFVKSTELAVVLYGVAAGVPQMRLVTLLSTA